MSLLNIGHDNLYAVFQYLDDKSILALSATCTQLLNRFPLVTRQRHIINILQRQCEAKSILQSQCERMLLEMGMSMKRVVGRAIGAHPNQRVQINFN